MLVISNRPRASRSSDFEITWAITPWIVLHSVELLLIIMIMIMIMIMFIIMIMIIIMIIIIINFENSSTGEISSHYSCQNGSILFINL